VKRIREKRPLPTRQEILDFIAQSPVPVGKREIARAFKVAPEHRVALKGLLRDIERNEPVERGRKRRLASPGALPEVTVIEITGLDDDGEALARPTVWPHDREPPAIRVVPGRDRRGAPGIGDHAVARLARVRPDEYEARVIRVLRGAPQRVLGVFRGTGEGGLVESTDRREKNDFLILRADTAGAGEGELVVAEVLAGRRMGLPRAKIVERIGDIADPRSISLVAIHAQGIPTEFPAEAVAQAESARPVALGERTDLRDIPLVTIDGADARDFDDAVWAEPDDDPDNPDGWHLLVAIADVAWYVRPGDPLDRAAEERGNSVYFPDRVVPMLPEALSNDLCSLRPGEDRACLAVHMWIDAEGRKRRHRFVRGLMRSAARLTYEEVQKAADGGRDGISASIASGVIRPLYGAFRALDKARRRRGALDLDLPERKVTLGPDGHVATIEPRPRLDSHRLIEEFMIAANVAAAETLEAMRQACMYRVHDRPDPAKIAALHEFLVELDLPGVALAKGQVAKPRQFNQLLHRVADTPYAALVNELVLRSQAQAVYSPDNIGHFGLALRRYAHFTSPIRRYADLLVHRALIAGGRLGEGALPDIAAADFAATAEHISMTERRAVAAERMAIDRYVVAFLADRVGATFHGRVNGVQRFGLFVTLEETGADGLVPIGRLPGDYYLYEEKQHRLVGRRSGRTYTMGDELVVRLAEANTTTGSLVLEPAEVEKASAIRFHRGRREGRRRRRG
jgi:ribonuclease R